MKYVLWLLMVGLDGEPHFTPVGLRPMTRDECIAVAEYQRVLWNSSPWPGKRYAWCDPEVGFPQGWSHFPEQKRELHSEKP